MAEHDSHQDEENLRAPEPLQRALVELQKERIFVPPAVDEAVLSAARRHLEREEAPRRVWQSWAPWAAAAASIVLLGVFAPGYFKASKSREYSREDINHDGRVDILDAFALARKIERGERGLRDVNGDGVVDGRDAAEIARHAVKLEKKGHS
jgi:hypothetical protein